MSCFGAEHKQRFLRDVGVGVQTEAFGGVPEGQGVYVGAVLLQVLALGDFVASVELETVGKHGFTEPHSTVRVQKSLIIVVCDTSSVLDFSSHVSDCVPRNTLYKRKQWFNSRKLTNKHIKQLTKMKIIRDKETLRQEKNIFKADTGN